ncbi:MAG: Omp28-related outer membrane protein, partial [Chlorobi bacterium]|nr:Omp28-related outer membrane protein [Chlorobiota bacterium]
MKKALLVLSLLFFLFPSIAGSQTTRTVLIEEFTGAWCGFCPYGAAVIEDILNTMGSVRALAYHRGDSLETPEGNIFVAAMRPAYPQAAIDRVLWPGESKIPVSRNSWRARCQARSALTSPVSITVTGTFHEPTRLLTANIKLTILADMSGEYRLNAIISESGINLRQKYYPPGGGTVYLDPYYHKHVVRKMITGAQGEFLTAAGFKTGDVINRTVTFTLPSWWNVDKCDFTVFVSKMVNGYYNEVQQAFQESIRSLFRATPVELVSFMAEQVDDGVLLTWRTARETSNAGWNVECRTADGSWKPVCFVPGNGTSTQPHYYEFIDRNPEMGPVCAYRLRQKDYDGRETLSPVALVYMEAAPTTTRLLANYPNPFNPETEIAFELDEPAHVVL